MGVLPVKNIEPVSPGPPKVRARPGIVEQYVIEAEPIASRET